MSRLSQVAVAASAGGAPRCSPSRCDQDVYTSLWSRPRGVPATTSARRQGASRVSRHRCRRRPLLQNRAMSSNAMRDARFCWADRFCKRLWPFLVAKAVCSTKTAPTQHNDGVNCDQLVRLLEPIAQPTPVFRPFFARSPKVLTKRFTWHPKTSRRHPALARSLVRVLSPPR